MRQDQRPSSVDCYSKELKTDNKSPWMNRPITTGNCNGKKSEANACLGMSEANTSVNPGILLPLSLTNPPEIPHNQKAGPSNVQLGGIPIAEYVPRNNAMAKSLKVFVIMFFGQ